MLFPGAVPAEVLESLLAAIKHHDDGWAAWQASPKIDPQLSRPYGFTEMPPPEAQALWTASVDACAELGPLEAYVVASHFIALQDDQDSDFGLWEPWLDEQDSRRSSWLAEWKNQSPQAHTRQLAERCVYLLQTFDWLSLWLCCRCPAEAADVPLNESLSEPLTLGDAANRFGPVRFLAGSRAATSAAWPVRLDRWPFANCLLEISAEAMRVPVARYETWQQVEAASEPATIRWQFTAEG